MATTSLLVAVQGVLDALSLRENGTATSGSTANLVAAAFPWKNTSSSASATTYQDCVIKVCDITDGTTFNERLIATYAPATGTFTPSNAFTITVATGDTFDIIKGGVHYDDVKSAINRALTKIFYRDTTILTLITDGDMEDSSSGWTDSGATSTKVTSGLIGMRGGKAIRVVNAAADDHTQSGTISCRSSQQYLLAATVRAAVGTAELVAYDITNSAEIKTETWDEVGEGFLHFTFTTPSTCEQIAVRLQGTTATSDTYWDDVILLRTGSHEIALPSWITQWDQVKRVYYGSTPNNRDNVVYHDYYTTRCIPDTGSANNEWRLWVDPAFHYPTWIEATRPYAELSAEADTTTCDKQLLILAGTAELLDTLINRAPGQEIAAWKQELRRVNRKLLARLWNRSNPVLRHQLNG